MRANVTRGSGQSLNQYLLDEQKRQPGLPQHNPIFYTNMVGQTTAELNAEFQLMADLRPTVKRSIAHYSISFPPGENPSLETKRAIVKDLLHQMGHGDCQFFAVEHFDQQHKRGVHHLHVATSTITRSGDWVSDRFDRFRLKDVERAIELKHGLQFCPPRAKGERRNLTTGEARQEERTGQPCTKRKLWDILDQAIADAPDLPTALLRVRASGAQVQFFEHDDGGKGLSFGLDGKHFPGKRLGDRYSFVGLQQYAKLDYQCDRDDGLLRQLHAMSQAECQARLAQNQSAIEAQRQAAAQTLLEFAFQRLTQTGRNPLKTRDDRYLITLDSQSGDVAISHRTEAGTGKIIAQGKRTEQGWEIAIAQVELEDQQHFERYQQQRQADLADRYGRYAVQKSEVNLTLEQRDLLVGWKALQAGESPAETKVILAAGSERAQALQQQQGREAGLEYLEQVMRELLAEREKQRKPQQRGIDR